MEYTISDIGTLRIYMYMWTVILTLVCLAIIVSSIMKVSFDLKPGKQSDVTKRRIIFFLGLAITVTLVFFLQLNFVINNFRSKILDEDMMVVVKALEQTIPITVITSGVLYITLFTVLAITTQQWIGYKPYTVLKSNNKWFGLF
jgi:hypothetical protein